MRPIEMFRVCLRCCDSNNLFNSLTFPDNTFLSMMTMVAGLEVLISGSYCIICGHVRERYGHSSSTSSPLYLSLSLSPSLCVAHSSSPLCGTRSAPRVCILLLELWLSGQGEKARDGCQQGQPALSEGGYNTGPVLHSSAPHRAR